jgi:hypothetical protein
MTTASGGTPQDYVRQPRLRNPLFSKSYRWILNEFQRFIAEQAEDNSISQESNIAPISRRGVKGFSI